MSDRLRVTMQRTSSPSIFICAVCNTYLDLPTLTLPNCGHSIHKRCFGAGEVFLSHCPRCNEPIFGAITDPLVEEVAATVNQLAKVILASAPVFNNNLPEQYVLFEAVAEGKDFIVKSLLNEGLSPNTMVGGVSVLYKACVLNRPTTVKILLERGARCSLRNDLVQEFKMGQGPLACDAREDQGAVPLRAAIEAGATECVERLLAAGASLDDPDDAGRTPIYFAVKERREELVFKFINLGAKLDVEERFGLSLLSLAVAKGLYQVALTLIQKGASVTRKDFGGYFPLYLAAERSGPEMILLLLKHGAHNQITELGFGGLTPIGAAQKAGKNENVRVLINYRVNSPVSPDGSPPCGECKVIFLPYQGGDFPCFVSKHGIGNGGSPDTDTSAHSIFNQCDIL